MLSCSQCFIRLIDQSLTNSWKNNSQEHLISCFLFFLDFLFSSFFVVSFDHASIFRFLGLRVSQLMGTSDNPFRISRIRPGLQFLGCPLSRVLRAHHSSCLFFLYFLFFLFFVVFSSFSVLCVFCVSWIYELATISEQVHLDHVLLFTDLPQR